MIKLLVGKGHLQSKLNHVILILHRQYNKMINTFIVYKLNNQPTNLGNNFIIKIFHLVLTFAKKWV